MVFISLNYPFFLVLLRIEEISVLYIRYSDFITVQTKIETKIWIFLSLLVS